MKFQTYIRSQLIAIFFLFAIVVFAQESKDTNAPKQRTLLSDWNGNVSHGGYGGITIAYSEIDAQASIQVGGRMAWIINHKFALGIAGNGFFNNLIKDDTYEPSDYYLAGGYGGLLFQPIISSHSPIHFSFPILLGVGGVAVNHKDYWVNDWDENSEYYYDSDVFLVFEPGIDIEFNMLQHMRMSLGVSYRFTNNVNLRYEYVDGENIKVVDISPTSLNNFSFKLGFFFGWF